MGRSVSGVTAREPLIKSELWRSGTLVHILCVLPSVFLHG